MSEEEGTIPDAEQPLSIGERARQNKTVPPKTQRPPSTTGLLVGMGLGGLAELGRTLKIRKELKSHTDSETIILTGNHFVTEEEKEIISKAYDHGDAGINFWYTDPRLQEDLIEAHPEVLTIDGISPSQDYIRFDKKRAWLSLPVRPQLLHPETKQVFAIATDNNYGNYIQDSSEASKKLDEIFYQEPTSFVDKIHIEDGVTAGVATLAAVTAAMTLYRERKNVDGGKESDNSGIASRLIKRSTFVKVMAGILGAVVINKSTKALGRAILQSDTDNNRLAGILKTISTSLDVMPDDVAREGRTALLLAKHEDGMKFLRENSLIAKEAKGAVIMGSGHRDKLNLYAHDKAARDEAILRYATHVMEVVGKVADGHFHFSGDQRSKFMQAVLDSFCSFQVVNITDPHITPTGSMDQYVHDNIKVMKPTNIGSRQVAQAIKTLR